MDVNMAATTGRTGTKVEEVEDLKQCSHSGCVLILRCLIDARISLEFFFFEDVC